MRPLIASIVLLALPALGFAQGVLTPAGAPAPTMKTLDQLEPRTPLKAGATGVDQNENGGFNINASGSYYLTANLTITSGDAIVITASYVTLDLNGFTLSSTTVSPASGTAVSIAANLSDITIRNGHIRGNTVYDATAKTFSGAGFMDGIKFALSASSTIRNILTDRITVSNVAGAGIIFVTNINGCTASVCGNHGLWGVHILDSSADTCRGTSVTAYETAANCVGSSIDGAGLWAATASNCRAHSETGTGLFAGTASNCYGASSSGIGLYADTATTCSAYTVSGPIAMNVTGTANTCRGNNGSGGTSIQAAIAVSCTTANGPIVAPQKFLGTP
jgi:hypothetical protein